MKRSKGKRFHESASSRGRSGVVRDVVKGNVGHASGRPGAASRASAPPQLWQRAPGVQVSPT